MARRHKATNSARKHDSGACAALPRTRLHRRSVDLAATSYPRHTRHVSGRQIARYGDERDETSCRPQREKYNAKDTYHDA